MLRVTNRWPQTGQRQRGVFVIGKRFSRDAGDAGIRRRRGRRKRGPDEQIAKRYPGLTTDGPVSGQNVPVGWCMNCPWTCAALIANATALDAWKDITPLARNEFICWVHDAKQETTRERRIRRTRRSWRKAGAGPAAGRGASTASARGS